MQVSMKYDTYIWRKFFHQIGKSLTFMRKSKFIGMRHRAQSRPALKNNVGGGHAACVWRENLPQGADVHQN